MRTKKQSDYSLDKQKNKHRYLLDNDVSDLLGISLNSLRNKIHLGQPLPPYISLPSSRKRLWPENLVHDWLLAYLVNNQASSKARITSIRKSAK